jgi:hypothetical protein
VLPNGQVSAAAVSTNASASEQVHSGCQQQTLLGCWAGHVPTTWHGTKCRPKTEAATNLPREQDRRFAHTSTETVRVTRK